VTTSEGETCPPPRLRHADLLLTGDEPHRVGSEGDSSREAVEVLVGFAPDRRTQGAYGLFAGSRGCAAGDGGDSPLRALRDHRCVELPYGLPRATGRSHPGPGGRHPGLRETEPLRLIGLRKLVDHDVALELGVGVHDPHREDRRCLVEESMGSERRGREGEHTVPRLQPYSLVRDP